MVTIISMSVIAASILISRSTVIAISPVSNSKITLQPPDDPVRAHWPSLQQSVRRGLRLALPLIAEPQPIHDIPSMNELRVEDTTALT
jgi:hypothetical protein